MAWSTRSIIKPVSNVMVKGYKRVANTVAAPFRGGGAGKKKAQVKCPEEGLSNPRVQLWALALGMVALPLTIYGMHAPLSCVYYSPEDAKAPDHCKGLATAQLRLMDFCWKPCEFNGRKLLMMCAMVAANLLQALVVIFNHDGCGSFLRLSWYFDLHDIFVGSDGGVDQKEAKGWVTRLQDYGKRQAERTVSKLAKHDVQNLASARAASKASTMCFAFALMRIAVIFTSEYSHHGVSFECTTSEGGHLRVLQKPETRWFLIIILAIAAIMLMLVMFIQFQTEWTVNVKVYPKDAKELKVALTRNPETKTFYVPTGTPRKMNGDKTPQAADAEPAVRGHCDSSGFDQLKFVRLLPLAYVKYQEIMYPPDLAIGQFPNNNEEDREVVQLMFKKRRLTILDEIDNEHRRYAVIFMGLSCWTMFTASTSCWTCVKGLSVPEEDVSPLQFDKWLLLMGACGRHADVGSRCLIAAALMVVALLQQFVIIFCSEKRLRGCPPEMDGSKQLQDRSEQLMLPFLDFRKNTVLDAKMYADAQSEMPTIMCYIWVTGNEETIMDCHVKQARHSGPDGEEVTFRRAGSVDEPVEVPRSEWRRSSKAHKVQLLDERRETQWKWMEGLIREEYSVPSLCIETVEPPDFQQIVPHEFVAGFFHGWVHLGPKLAWEVISAVLVLAAVVLALVDFLVWRLSPTGGFMSSCNDILNTRQCLIVGMRNPLAFRQSNGVLLACAGGLFAVCGLLALRVARNPDAPACPWTAEPGKWREPRTWRCCLCLGAYANAIVFCVEIFCKTLAGVICIPWDCCMQQVIPCCTARPEEEEIAKQEPLLDPAAGRAAP